MILKKLEIQGYGPFPSKGLIDIDENVTVLTGQNDVGKSSILRLIRLMCGDVQPNEDDQNNDRSKDAAGSWSDDNGVWCVGTFVLDDAWSHYFHESSLLPNDEVEVNFEIFSKRKTLTSIRRGPHRASQRINESNLHVMPSVLHFPTESEIRSSFNYENANELEKYLLFMAFGSEPEKKLQNMTGHNLRAVVQRANRDLANNLKQFLPKSVGLEFYLHVDPKDPLPFSVTFSDVHGGITPILRRGSGIRKIVSVLVALAKAQAATNHIYVLLDEPENSLHADSQHKLRSFLEDLGTKPNIQVIYTTHSPSMINTLNCKGLRLLERATTQDGRATTRVINDPYNNNFLSGSDQPWIKSSGLTSVRSHNNNN